MFQREFAQRLVAKPGDKLYCRYVSPSKTCLEFSIAVMDPGSRTCAFFTSVSGIWDGKKSGSGIRIRDEHPSLETVFWVKIRNFFDADPDPGSVILDPG
jgi:hypothetical protein